MQKNENEIKNENKEMVNNSGEVSPAYVMPEMTQPSIKSTTMPMMKYQMVYPEIFYKVQPFVMMVCDQMDFGFLTPTMDMVQQMTDSIYDDICRMYPDLAEYAKSNENNDKADPPYNDDFDTFGRRFRRRGLLKDIIDILLISELFGRRRRPY